MDSSSSSSLRHHRSITRLRHKQQDLEQECSDLTKSKSSRASSTSSLTLSPKVFNPINSVTNYKNNNNNNNNNNSTAAPTNNVSGGSKLFKKASTDKKSNTPSKQNSVRLDEVYEMKKFNKIPGITGRNSGKLSLRTSGTSTSGTFDRKEKVSSAHNKGLHQQGVEEPSDNDSNSNNNSTKDTIPSPKATTRSALGKRLARIFSFRDKKGAASKKEDFSLNRKFSSDSTSKEKSPGIEDKDLADIVDVVKIDDEDKDLELDGQNVVKHDEETKPRISEDPVKLLYSKGTSKGSSHMAVMPCVTDLIDNVDIYQDASMSSKNFKDLNFNHQSILKDPSYVQVPVPTSPMTNTNIDQELITGKLNRSASSKVFSTRPVCEPASVRPNELPNCKNSRIFKPFEI